MIKTIIPFLLFFLLIQNNLLAQSNGNKDFIIFYNDSIIYGKIVFEDPYENLEINSKNIPLEQIKFYKKGHNIYANTKDVNLSGYSTFAKRIVKGKINLYEDKYTHQTPGYFNSSGMYYGGTSSRFIFNYYNIGYGNLKKTKYKNLKTDLSDHSESLKHLKKYRALQNTQTGFFIAGAGAIIVGFITLNSKLSTIDSTPDTTPDYLTIGAGLACGLIGYTISLSKPEHLEQAITTYNRASRRNKIR